MLVCVYICQNDTLLEITCHGSIYYVFFVFSYERGGLVALNTGVHIHVHYAWAAIKSVLCAIKSAGMETL